MYRVKECVGVMECVGVIVRERVLYLFKDRVMKRVGEIAREREGCLCGGFD